MKRAWLEEDLQLIRTYFPGARTVALRTPFDLTDHDAAPNRLHRTHRQPAHSLPHNVSDAHGWTKEVLWTH